jgi:hypothetical protein
VERWVWGDVDMAKIGSNKVEGLEDDVVADDI